MIYIFSTALRCYVGTTGIDDSIVPVEMECAANFDRCATIECAAGMSDCPIGMTGHTCAESAYCKYAQSWSNRVSSTYYTEVCLDAVY